MDAANETQLKGLQLLQERYSDPILTGLTVLLRVMMFVIAPLQAADVIDLRPSGWWWPLAWCSASLSCREARSRSY